MSRMMRMYDLSVRSAGAIPALAGPFTCPMGMFRGGLVAE